MNAPTDYQISCLDGLLRAEETGVPYWWGQIPRPTRMAMRREGWTDGEYGGHLTDTGRALVIGWRLGQKKRRRCA